MACLSQEKQLLGGRIRLASRDLVPNSMFLLCKAREHTRNTKGGGGGGGARRQEVLGKKERSSGTGVEIVEGCPRVTMSKKGRNAFPTKCRFYYPILAFLKLPPSRLTFFWAFCLMTVLGTVKWQQTVLLLAHELSICHVLTFRRTNLWLPQIGLWVEKAVVGLWGQQSGE